MCDSIEDARRRYSEELRYTARLSSQAVIAAFATVPRERFFGPGPWRLLSPKALGEYWTTEDSDPRHLRRTRLTQSRPSLQSQRTVENGGYLSFAS